MEKYDIIVLGGQSNAEGYGVGPVSEEYVPDERILWLNDNANPRFEKDENNKDVFKMDTATESTITVADEPIGKDGKVGKLAFLFSKGYIQSGLLKEGRKILILNAAVGGTGFRDNQWGLERGLYKRLKRMTKAALQQNPDNRIVAFLWHQGECDSFENAEWSVEQKYKTHKKNLGEMFDDFTDAFNCKHVPIISAGFCDEWYLKYKTPCDAVLKAIQEVVEERNGCFVETAGLKSNNEECGNGDDIHFSRESAHILGKKMFEVFSVLQKNII